MVTFSVLPASSTPPILPSPLAAPGEKVQIIWTCPDWEVDWISELLIQGGVPFSISFDRTFSTFVPNALVAVSQELVRPNELAPEGMMKAKMRR